MVTVQHVQMAANTQTGVACLSAVSFAHASVYPSYSVGTRLDNFSLRIAIALRQGAWICEPHICVCGDPVDLSGTHGLSC